MSFMEYVSFSWPLLAACLTLLIGREIWNLFYFKRRGIPGPRPLPLLGNLLEWRHGVHKVLMDYAHKYDKVYGLFMFRQPIYVIGDLDMLKEVMVKSFNSFANHKAFVVENRPFHRSLTQLRDQHWKNVRNIMTPAFSASKIKRMAQLINECADTLVENFGKTQEKDNHVECFKLFGGFTMDGIAKCAFGLQIDSQNNPDDPFVKNATTIFKGSIFNPVIMLAGMFPPVAWLVNYFEYPILPRKIFDFFQSVIDQTTSMRKQSDDKRKDFLQLLINAHELDDDVDDDEEEMDVDKDRNKLLDVGLDTRVPEVRKKIKMKLTSEEVFGQAMLFFLAGYETTNITLGFAAYSLATNPEVQDKLIEEIDEVTPTRDSVNYNSIGKMQYLDGVVCETLRLYPPASGTERECNEEFTYNGVTIPKGGQIMAPLYCFHHDPELWPEPEKFDPTRFFKGNREGRHPLAWMPFGVGPRNCIGMRFALLEVKMALVRLLQKYRFEVSPETVVPVKLGPNSVKPTDGIKLRVAERK